MFNNGGFALKVTIPPKIEVYFAKLLFLCLTFKWGFYTVFG